MNIKTIYFIVDAFRHRDDEFEKNEFVNFSSYSKNLELVMQELEDYIRFSNNIHHSLCISMYEDDKRIWRKEFDSDEKFFNFNVKVKDARIDDYKEWLLSNYQDGAIKSLPASNG